MRTLLGISAYYHDSAAVLLVDGGIVAAAQEERFSRRKNDERFPEHAVRFCLKQGAIGLGDLDAVVFYDKPVVKFSRMLESFLAIVPAGLPAWLRVLPAWLSEKLNLRQTIRDELDGLPSECPILFTEHHVAHAASAFYPSPFDRAAILTVDGVGEWATTTINRGVENRIEMLRELRFPHSLGLLYSAFTAYCGFRVNSGEYKLMGLAPYGEPRFADAIFDNIIDLKPDGSFRLNMDCFGFLRGTSMTNRRFEQLLGGPPRDPESPFEQRHMDVAASVQGVVSEAMLRLARQAREVTGESRLCLAGGVALNCVANGRLQRAGLFDEIWIQPAAGDAGGALGAALETWRQYKNTQPKGGGEPAWPSAAGDAMRGSLLGPEFSEAEIRQTLEAHGAVFERFDEAAMLERAAELLDSGAILGWFQGRMEFGPRALGSRSILGDARSASMRSAINQKVKFRESFRPFAPAVLEERWGDYFDLTAESPYMLLVADVAQRQRLPKPANESTGFARLKHECSTLPAVTHVDGSARIQTVGRERHPFFWRLLKQFEQRTGCGVLLNTSFNVRGEPVVCTPDDAYRCFVNTAIDWLAIGPFLLSRERQPVEKPQPAFDAIPD
ncbi:MAG TPA: carbamoyltransferase [Verrucomicrobiota bacterium]|nr:carbamoyltransferase [Verrucomicrobiota bacterium]